LVKAHPDKDLMEDFLIVLLLVLTAEEAVVVQVQ
jgi:hypothetical protein